MKRKRKDVCASPPLCESPKRTKIQAQRKFAQNSGINCPIITPIRDLDISDDPHTSALPAPVELLPMKRPNTEDFLTFLCFRGTPILPSNLQFFNTASIVADGQVHEIKGDCPKNGPIDIAKCASGSSSEKPFIAFGVRKRADPIVISRQMERKRRHAIALQALRRKYQEQKMAKIRALTISKLSEKTTNRTLVKTNTVQKTETSVTKKSSTKVIATRHVKVTTQTLKSKVKPKMCLRSFPGKFIQKELPFRPKRSLPETVLLNAGRTSKNSNKWEEDTATSVNRPIRQPVKAKIKPVGSVVRSSTMTSIKRQQIKRRILVPSTGVTSIIRPKLRSTTLKKTVISRRKAQQRTKSSNRVREPFNQLPAPIKKSKPEEESLKSTPPPQEIATSPSPESPRRLTRRSSDILNTKTKPGQNDKIRRELRKKLEVKREVNVAESVSRRMVKKDLDVKRDFSLKTRNRDIKKNVALHKSCDTVVEKTKAGNKVTLDQKTMEVTTVQRVLTRKAEEAAAKVPHRPVKPEQKKVSKSTEEVKPVSRKAPTRPQSPKTNESQKRKPPIARESKNKREQIPRRQTRDYSSKLAESKDVVVASKVNQDAPKKAESKNMPVASDNAPKNTEKKNEEVPSDVNQDASKKANNDDVIVASKFNQDAFKKAQSKDVIAASKVNQDASEKAESSNMVVASEVNQNAPKKAESKNIVVASKVCKDAPKKTESKNIVALKVNKEASKKVQSKDMVVVDTVNQDALKRAESKYLVVASNVKQDATKKAESEDVAVVSKVNQDVPKKAESKYLVVAANVKQDATKKAESEDVAVVSKVNEDIPKKAESNVLVACKANQNDIKKEDVEESVPPQPKVNINEGEEETRAKELSKTGKDAAKEVLSEVGKVTKESPSSVTSLQKEATPEAKQEIIIEGTNYAKKTAKGLPVAEVKVRTPEPKQQLTTKASGDAKKVALRVQNDSKQDTAKIQSKKLTNKKLVSETTIQSQVISQAKQEILAETKKGSIALSTSQDISEIKQEVVKDITKLLRKPPKRSSVAPQVSTRPTRKSKEAAAIYMEILSHKLVNDNTIDDDNVSIDSFPELPNVKRTEQREIELKAQAKTSKEDDERKPLAGDVSVDKNTNPTDDESDNEVLQAKIAKRRTKREENSQKNDSSDESFRADVKVPMKKKNTRRSIKGSSVLEKNVDIILEAARVLEATPQEDSDETSTSDMNLKSLQVKQRKKLSERTDPKFSDSDEEPLAKFTSKISKPSDQKPVTSRKTADKQLANVTTVMEPKPKRECAKRPSYYLPMMSSSDEDEEPYFHGFSAPKEELKKVQTLVPSLDLLSKDIGRKEKVNMSNEQIEQWLKDSALAGSSVAKENDAMLKFGEKIPVETLKTNTPPRTPNLKLKIEEPRPESSKEEFTDRDAVKTTDVKSLLGDRKWIFKKDKKQPPAPNKNAFSPDNECSVYAFGEDNEEVVSTPFRRPSRRPSSTATSRSEDETSKTEEATKIAQFRKPISSDSENSRCFNVPQNPAKQTKPSKSDSMVPPSSASHPVKRSAKQGVDRHPEPFDDAKYKVPSSPSASSGSSSKLYKKGTQKPKTKGWECVNPVYVSDFPKPTDPAKLVEAPVFHPTEQEFQDPLEYIERVRHKAEQFGICKIVPPSSFKPECKVADDMRFTAYNQYVHKMLHRWGPNFKEFVAIRKYLATQSISLKTPPLIGGMEVDLPRLYQTVQSLGGLKEVIEKKKWSKVSESMKIPKSAQDRVTKLDDIYCKYLLPYDTLSPAEREKLFEEVELYWTKKQNQSPPNQAELNSEQDSVDSDDNDGDSECTIKGKNMALNALYRIARNTMSMYFKVPEPSTAEVEQEFWRYVTQKRNHICVHSASIDCGTWGYGFAVAKNSPFAKHPWNLKVLSNNGGSVLRSLGPVMGVTIPTLHVGMVFSACCWYRDPHGLPWVEYLHTGGTKIWYGIPSTSCDLFRAAMRKLVPGYCREKELWLPSDTAMVPPEMLLEHQVSLCRTVQEPGQFVVVFPKVYTSGICTGYVVSESVYFAPLYWLKTARSLFNDLKTSCEPSMFSLEKLFVSIANDVRSNPEVLKTVLPFIEELCENERSNREKLRAMSPVQEEKIIDSEPPSKKKKILSVDGDLECEICRTNLFVSMVVDLRDEVIYCLEHALVAAEKDEKALSTFKLRYHLDDAELAAFPKRINSSIEGKQQKKLPGKYAGLPTLLK